MKKRKIIFLTMALFPSAFLLPPSTLAMTISYLAPSTKQTATADFSFIDSTHDLDKELARARGFDLVLGKPVEPDALREAVVKVSSLKAARLAAIAGEG